MVHGILLHLSRYVAMPCIMTRDISLTENFHEKTLANAPRHTGPVVHIRQSSLSNPPSPFTAG